MIKKGDIIYWTPRIISIIFILFLALFSLDVFDESSGFMEIILGLLIHNIPSIILTIFLIITWKKEIFGTFIFTIFGLLYLILIVYNFITNPQEIYSLAYLLLISGPSFLIAYLFWLNWKKRNK